MGFLKKKKWEGLVGERKKIVFGGAGDRVADGANDYLSQAERKLSGWLRRKKGRPPLPEIGYLSCRLRAWPDSSTRRLSFGVSADSLIRGSVWGHGAWIPHGFPSCHGLRWAPHQESGFAALSCATSGTPQAVGS